MPDSRDGSVNSFVVCSCSWSLSRGLDHRAHTQSQMGGDHLEASRHDIDISNSNHQIIDAYNFYLT